MKLRNLLVLLSACLFLASCGSMKNGVSSMQKQADAKFVAGNYSEALALYEKIDSLHRDSLISYRMTISALQLNQYVKAYGYSKGCSIDEEISNGFRKFTESLVSNQREVAVIEGDQAYFYKLVGKDYLIEKLGDYYTYCRSEKIIGLYDEMDKADVRAKYFPEYLNQIKNIKSDKEVVGICLAALKDNKDQVSALKYLGTERYNSAEAEYKTAMAEYNKKKNSTTYAYLLRDLKVITKEYQKSRDYLEKVHKLDAEDQNTIRMLINIYNRLDQPSKAKSYQKLLK